MSKRPSSKLRTFFIKFVQGAARLAVHGRIFRLYAKPSPPAVLEAGRLRIAVCYLIPSLGDNVMVFPLIDAIRHEHPEAEISCFASRNNQILRLHPEINHFYEMPDAATWTRKLGPAGHILNIWKWHSKELKNLRFDLCVVLRGGVDPFHSAHLAWLLGGRERIGHSSRVEPERNGIDLGADLMLTKRIEKIGKAHEVQRGGEVLHLAGLIQNPIELNVPVASLLSIAQSLPAREYVAQLRELQRPYGLIAPGASFVRRRWASDRFAVLAKEEIVKRGWTPVFVGGPEDRAICDSMAATLDVPSLNLAGKTSFVQLAGVCADAQCFIGNDSGTAHVASALGVPTLIVTAFAKTSLSTHHASPDRSQPLGPYSAVIQPLTQAFPCTEECLAEEQHCILQVQVDQMQRAFADLMERAKLPKASIQ